MVRTSNQTFKSFFSNLLFFLSYETGYKTCNLEQQKQRKRKEKKGIQELTGRLERNQRPYYLIWNQTKSFTGLLKRRERERDGEKGKRAKRRSDKVGAKKRVRKKVRWTGVGRTILRETKSYFCPIFKSGSSDTVECLG